MNTIYAQKSYFESRQAELIKHLEHTSKKCKELPVTCSKHEGKWGIWFIADNSMLLIEPISLFNSLFKNDNYYMFMTYEGQKYSSHYVNVHKSSFCINWTFEEYDLPIEDIMTFKFNEYVNKITSSFEKLYEVMKNNEDVHYNNNDIKLQALEVCLKQITIKSTLPSEYRLMTSDVVEEEFHFSPIDDEEYCIGIGNRSYKTFLTHWNNDCELIRHQLESIIYYQDAIIKLDFDDSDTIIKIELISILDEVNKCGDGYGYKYKDYAKVTIESNCFANMPIIVGFCGYKKTISTLYEGLLRMTLFYSEKGDDYSPSRLEAYNMYKSPLIENFLKCNKRDHFKAMDRQIKVKEVITICPDYDYFLMDEHHCCLDLNDLYDKQGIPIEMPEFDEWQQKIKGIIVAANVGQQYTFDWDSYHKRGLELAYTLRDRLSTDFDLWYNTPFEDKSELMKEYSLINLRPSEISE